MDITYQIINSSRDKLRLYRFRKQVFVDEEKRLQADGDLITDLYDSIDETVNIAAVCNEKIVGALRVTLESGAGFPGDRHWDFSAYRSRLSGLCVNFGWLCCSRQFRQRKGLIKALVAKGAEQAGHS